MQDECIIRNFSQNDLYFQDRTLDSEKYGIKYVPYNKINMELILNETPAYVVEKVAECYL